MCKFDSDAATKPEDQRGSNIMAFKETAHALSSLKGRYQERSEGELTVCSLPPKTPLLNVTNNSSYSDDSTI